MADWKTVKLDFIAIEVGMSRFPLLTSTVLGLGLILACGGGGSSVSSSSSLNPTPTLAPGQSSYSVSATSQGVVGHGAVAALKGVGGSLSNVAWTQTSGPAVSLLSDKDQVLTFDPTQAGTYEFQATFKDAFGASQTQNVSIPVAAQSSGSFLTLRLSQSVRMGGNVSVRAWPTLATGDAATKLTWTQVEGPSVALDTTSTSVAFFTAPSVSQDTLIRLRATLQTSSGTTDSDEVSILVQKYTQASDADQNAIWGGFHVSRVYPYLPNGPYAGVLVDAAFNANQSAASLTPLSKLPFLAQEAADLPSVEQVMNHVLVSHDWLGRNFEQFLRTQDDKSDFRRLLKGVTAIVLGAHIRPAFYYSGTGAIYLDADYLWLTPEERDTIDETPDYRSGYGNDLNFSGPARYVKNNAYVLRYYYPDQRVTRTQANLLPDLASLLYHELGHATDFLPPSSYASLDNSKSAWGNLAGRISGKALTSDGLASAYPLQSQEMYGLADVQFHGATATATQKAYTSTQVAGFFSGDRATDQYAYSTSREDVAMIFEEFMMNVRLGIQRDVAIADKITDTTTASNLYVTWGQRGRIGAPEVKPRVAFVVSRLAPWLDPSLVTNLPAPIAMTPGASWLANLTLGSAAQAKVVEETSVDPSVLKRDLRRHF